jgi:hypothetical protein
MGIARRPPWTSSGQDDAEGDVAGLVPCGQSGDVGGDLVGCVPMNEPQQVQEAALTQGWAATSFPDRGSIRIFF